MDDGTDGGAGFLDEGVPLRKMGDYELLEVIGRGGMGTVYRALDERTGAVRALKMISAGELASPQARRRFMQEAGAAAGLKHPNIVTIHEVSSHDGMPFYVMDCVEGRTLADAVRERPMPAHAAAACVAKVAGAIQHAHECGVLHRDLKPANILLDHLGEPQVTDFGLARHVNADSSLTGSQQILGSPAYMSPEQAAGRTKALGVAADVYSLGAVLYHLLTGRPPFQGDSPQAVLRQVTDDEPVPPRRILPSIPRELETVTLKCLEKNPSRRYVSAGALEHELERYLRGEPVLARPVGRAGKCWRWMRRNPAISALSAVLVAGAATGVGFMLQSHRQLQQSDAEKSSALTEKEATLAESLLWQAEFQRLTGKPGQREGGLQAIREAMKLPLSPEQKLRARNAVIAALALPDAKFVPDKKVTVPSDPALLLADPLCEKYATATKEGQILVTSIKDGKVLEKFDCSPRRINALLRWSDDGQYIAYRYDDTKVGLALMGAGNLKWVTAEVWPPGARSTPNQVGFHPLPGPGLLRPHRMLHPEADGHIAMREAFSGVMYRRVKPPEGKPLPEWVAVSWDTVGNRLAAAAGSRPEIVIWDMNESPPKIVQTLPCKARVDSLEWEAKENWLLAGDSEGRLTVWNPTTGQAQPPFEGHTQAIVSSATGPKNYRHASASLDGTVRLWDRTAFRPVLTLPGQATRLIFTRGESRVGPVIHDGSAGWYDLQWPASLRVLSSLENAEGSRCVVLNGSGLFLASLTGRSVVVWKMNPVSGHPLSIPVERPAMAAWMANSPRLVVAAPDGMTGYTLRSANNAPLAAPEIARTQPKVLEGAFSDVSFNGDATLMAVVRSDSGLLEVYNVESPGIDDERIIRAGQKRFSVPAAAGTRCALSPDGQWLAAGSPGGRDARVYRVADGALVAELAKVREAQNWLPVFSSDGVLLMFGGRTAHVMECGNWSRCDPLAVPPNNGTGHGVEIVNAGRGDDFLAAVGADEEIYLFRRNAPGECVATLRSPAGAVIGGLQCYRGMLCAAAPRGEVQLWLLATLRDELEQAGVPWRSGGAVTRPGEAGKK